MVAVFDGWRNPATASRWETWLGLGLEGTISARSQAPTGEDLTGAGAGFFPGKWPSVRVLG